MIIPFPVILLVCYIINMRKRSVCFMTEKNETGNDTDGIQEENEHEFQGIIPAGTHDHRGRLYQ